MPTENYKIVENGNTIHPETNTSQVYHFNSEKWLNTIVDDLPDVYAAKSHTHDIADINNLQNTLNGIAASVTEINSSTIARKVDGVAPDSQGNITLNAATSAQLGAVETRVTKLEQGGYFTSVKDFGAKGDGITDDTASIQAAIDSVRVSASGTDGALVFFPAGTYLINAPIQTYGNITIQGVGRRGSTLKLKAGTVAGAMITRVGNNNAYWVQIKDIALDGQASLQTATTEGIRLQNCTEALIENVSIRYVRGNGIRFYGSNGEASIQPSIRGCLIRADVDNHPADSSGILLDQGSYDGQISDNDIGLYKNGYGIYTIAHNGAYLSNNNCWQNKQGFKLQSSNRLRLTGCLSDYSQEYGFFSTSCTELQFSNCQSRWSSNKVGALQVYDGFHMLNTQRFLISGCTVYGGNGTDTVAGGLGRTAFALALVGNTSNGMVSGLLHDNTKGKYYKDASVTNVTESTFTAIP